jgi:hypothetical protein
MDVKYIAIIKIYIFLFFKIAKALAVFISFIGKRLKKIIVVSSSIRVRENIMKRLVAYGIKLWNRYFSSIKEIHRMTVIYIFSEKSTLGCIVFQLNILEAID